MPLETSRTLGPLEGLTLGGTPCVCVLFPLSDTSFEVKHSEGRITPQREHILLLVRERGRWSGWPQPAL